MQFPKLYDISHLAKYDKVELHFDSLVGIHDWMEKGEAPDVIHIPLTSGVLEIAGVKWGAEHQTAYLLFDASVKNAEPHIEFTLFGASMDEKGDRWSEFYAPEEREAFVQFLIVNEGSSRKDAADVHELLMCDYIAHFTAVMGYIAHFSAQTEERFVEEKVQSVKRKKAGRKGGKNRVTYITKRVIRINELPKSDTNVEEKRTIDRQSQAWTVRGHPRTYKKSGKTIWIDQYEKGEKRGQGKADPKTYKITKESVSNAR